MTTKSNKHKHHDDALFPEHWMQKYWRPMMAIQYMVTCLCDFVLFPILWTLVQAKDKSGLVTAQWQPITLLAGGFYHMSMGAILGISAWGRTKEKTADNTPYQYIQNSQQVPPASPSTYANSRHAVVPQGAQPPL